MEPARLNPDNAAIISRKSRPLQLTKTYVEFQLWLMEYLLKLLKDEWAVITDAPISFCIIALMAFGASYLWHRERILTLTEQKKIRDDDLAYLKDKTGAEDVRALAHRLSDVEDWQRKLDEIEFD